MSAGRSSQPAGTGGTWRYGRRDGLSGTSAPGGMPGRLPGTHSYVPERQISQFGANPTGRRPAVMA